MRTHAGGGWGTRRRILTVFVWVMMSIPCGVGTRGEETVEDPEKPVAGLFAVPTAQLRTWVEEKIEAPVAVVEVAAEQKNEVEEWVLSVEKPVSLSETTIQAFESMNGGAVLTYVEAPEELGGAAGWLTEKVWDPVFAPEVVKIGKVRMTGGVVAAIKRKNPFCLLNPLVFGMGW